MATILTLSSEVASGHIGNAAARFVLQRLGHTVWSLPSVVLSNHPGHAAVAGTRLPPETLEAMLDALAANGWLGSVDAVMTGYLPSGPHVAVAVGMIARVRAGRPDAVVLVDPVLGDDPKGLYIEQAAAEAIRDTLIGTADIVTPNRFELSWLTGREVTGIASAIAAARLLSVRQVVATSIAGAGTGEPRAAGMLATVFTKGGTGRAGADSAGGAGDAPHTFLVPHREKVPHGTGDTLAALVLGHLLRENGAPDVAAATGRAVAGLDTIIAASLGRPDLDLTGTQKLWADDRDDDYRS